jgi:hypothetical protein
LIPRPWFFLLKTYEVVVEEVVMTPQGFVGVLVEPAIIEGLTPRAVVSDVALKENHIHQYRTRIWKINDRF